MSALRGWQQYWKTWPGRFPVLQKHLPSLVAAKSEQGTWFHLQRILILFLGRILSPPFHPNYNMPSNPFLIYLFHSFTLIKHKQCYSKCASQICSSQLAPECRSITSWNTFDSVNDRLSWMEQYVTWNSGGSALSHSGIVTAQSLAPSEWLAKQSLTSQSCGLWSLDSSRVPDRWVSGNQLPRILVADQMHLKNDITSDWAVWGLVLYKTENIY